MTTMRTEIATPRRGARPGFTIVEVLVAVIILSVGVLALASTAALTGRQIGEGGARSRAASLALSRFEVVAARAAAGCDAIVPVGGSVPRDSTLRGIRERWTITRPVNNGTVVVVDTITLPRVSGTLNFQSVVRCN